MKVELVAPVMSVQLTPSEELCHCRDGVTPTAFVHVPSLPVKVLPSE